MKKIIALFLCLNLILTPAFAQVGVIYDRADFIGTVTDDFGSNIPEDADTIQEALDAIDNSREWNTKLPIPAADSGTIWMSGYYSIPSTGNTLGAGGSSQMNFINGFNKARIRQDGVLRQVQFWVNSKPAALTAFYMDIWRFDASSGYYDRISHENILSLMTAGQVNLITLASPVDVKEGDFTGFSYTSSSDPGNFLALADSGTSSFNRQPDALMYTTGAVTANDFNWAGTTLSTNYMPIRGYTDVAPEMVFLGDSTMVGFGFTPSFTNQTTLTNYNPIGAENFAQRIAHGLGYTYQNMGIGGEKTTNIAARLSTDLVALKPRVMLYAASINDAQGTQDNADFRADVEAILDACINIGCIPIAMRYLPQSNVNGTNAKMQILDDYDAILVEEATERDVIIFDPKPYVAKFRTGGDAGNLWDWQDRYTSDRTHPNDEGFSKIAEVAIQAIAKHTIKGGLEVGSLNVNQNITLSSESTFASPPYKKVELERIVGYEKPGVGLLVGAGASSQGSENEDGGDLTLQSGLSTGTGKSDVVIKTTYPGVTGTVDTEPDQKAVLKGDGKLGLGVSSPSTRLDINSYIIGPVIYKTNHDLNDLTVGGTYTANFSAWYKIKIDGEGTPDTFTWSNDGGATWEDSGVAMTGSAQTLNNGVTITWAATTGHTEDDEFDFYVMMADPLRIRDGRGNEALYVGSDGRSRLGYNATQYKKLDINRGTISLNASGSPAAPTVAVNVTSGNLNGAYRYRIEYTTDPEVMLFTTTKVKHTNWSPASSSVSPSNQQVDLTNIPVSDDPRMTGITIYRTLAGGSSYYKLASISNGTTSYTDNTADASLTELHEDHEDTTTNEMYSVESGVTAGVADFNSQLWFAGGRNAWFGTNIFPRLRCGYYNVALGRNIGSSLWCGDRNTVGGYGSLSGNPSDASVWGANAGNSGWSQGRFSLLGSDTDISEGMPVSNIAGSDAAGAGLSVGYYLYKVSFVLDGVESHVSRARPTTGIQTTSGNQQINLTSIPTYSGGQTCSARKLYRTKVISTAPTSSDVETNDFYLLATISNNTTTTYTDTTADASLGAIVVGQISSVALGKGSKTQWSNQLVAGSTTDPITDVMLGGAGLYHTTPSTTVTWHLGHGSGSNKAGSNLVIYPGKGTGNATASSITFQTPVVGSSGSVLQTLTNRFVINGDGTLTVAGLAGSGTRCVQVSSTGVISASSSGCGGTPTYNSIIAPTANSSINFGNFTNAWTSTFAGEFWNIDAVNGQTALNISDGNLVVADNATIAGTLTVGGESVCVEDGTNCPAGLVPSLNDVTNPDDNTVFNFGNFTNVWTSTKSGTFFQILGPSAITEIEGDLTVGGDQLCREDGTNCPAGIGSTAMDDIGDPDANTVINMTTFTNVWTSTADGSTMLTLNNTDADNLSDTSLLDLKFTDDGDVNSIFLQGLDNTSDVIFKITPNGLEFTGSGGHWEIPEGSGSPTTPADTMSLAVDSGNRPLMRHESDGNSFYLDHWEKSLVILEPTSSDAFLFFKAPYPITITGIDTIVDPADSSESVVVEILECNSTGDSCTPIDSTITADNDGASDDGSLSNASIDTNDWMMIDLGTVTGTVSALTVTIKGKK